MLGMFLMMKKIKCGVTAYQSHFLAWCVRELGKVICPD